MYAFDDLVFDDFNIKEEGISILGHGAFGVVYLVHGKDHIDYAVKVQKYDDFKEYEWECSQKIKGKSPFLVILYQQIVVDPDIYIKMEFANLSTLTCILKIQHTHSGMRMGTVDLMFQILCGVGVLHENGLIHRDLKSDNIMLHKAVVGETERIVCKITDYGLIRPFNGDLTPSGDAPTPLIMAPEVVDVECGVEGARYGRKADMWSVGIVFYELVTNGRHPLEAAQTLPDLVALIKQPIMRPDALIPNKSSTTMLPSALASPSIPPTSSFASASVSPSTTSSPPPPLTEPAVLDACWDLIHSLLSLDPNDRPTAKEAMRSRVFEMCGPPEAKALFKQKEGRMPMDMDWAGRSGPAAVGNEPVVAVAFRPPTFSPSPSPSSSPSSSPLPSPSSSPSSSPLPSPSSSPSSFPPPPSASASSTSRFPSAQVKISPAKLAIIRDEFLRVQEERQARKKYHTKRISQERLTLLRGLFRTFDTDHNNALDFDEVTQCLHHTDVALGEADIQRLFDMCDTNRTGIIEFTEFIRLYDDAWGLIQQPAQPTQPTKPTQPVAATTSASSSSSSSSSSSAAVASTLSLAPKSLMVTPERLAAVRREFRKGDKDGSGFIDVAVAKACLVSAGVRLKDIQLAALVDTADVNRTGKVDFNKFLKLYNSSLEMTTSSSSSSSSSSADL